MFLFFLTSSSGVIHKVHRIRACWLQQWVQCPDWWKMTQRIYMCVPSKHQSVQLGLPISTRQHSAPSLWVVETWLPSSAKKDYFLLILLGCYFFLKNMNLFGTHCHLQKMWYKGKNVNQVSSSSVFCIYCCNGKIIVSISLATDWLLQTDMNELWVAIIDKGFIKHVRYPDLRKSEK